MRNIYLITDYKGQFGSKQKSEPYMGGFDRDLLARRFLELGYTWDDIAQFKEQGVIL